MVAVILKVKMIVNKQFLIVIGLIMNAHVIIYIWIKMINKRDLKMIMVVRIKVNSNVMNLVCGWLINVKHLY